MATHSSNLAWKIPWTRGTWWATVHGVTKSQTRLSMHTHTALLEASHTHRCRCSHCFWLPTDSPLICQLLPASICAWAGSLTTACVPLVQRGQMCWGVTSLGAIVSQRGQGAVYKSPILFFSMGCFWGVFTVSLESQRDCAPFPLTVTLMWKHLLLAFLLSWFYLSFFLKTPPNKPLASESLSQSLFGGNLNKDKQGPVSWSEVRLDLLNYDIRLPWILGEIACEKPQYVHWVKCQ